MAVLHPVSVPLGDRAYEVHIADHLGGLGRALAEQVASRRVLLVTDDHVGPRWGHEAVAELRSAGFEVETVMLAAGEAHKTVESWWIIVDAALRWGMDRGTPILALGGGVVGDLAGFAAASVLRGVPFVQVPTSLLAMVDSSVGGKTGFDHPRGKNLVGAFHQPRLVWAPLALLATLPVSELRSGLGEVVKTALIADPVLFATLEAKAEALAGGEGLGPVIARCVAIKAGIVVEDEHESGPRMALNAGHTVGHALELVAGLGHLPHGVAVGLGLLAEVRWGERVGLVEEPGLSARIEALLTRLGLPVVPPALEAEALVRAMRLDKKGSGDRLILPMVVRIGEIRRIPLPVERLHELVT